MYVVDTLVKAQAELGECPLWDARRSVLYWVDIQMRTLSALSWGDRECTSWALPALGGGLGLAESEQLIVAVQSGIYMFDPRSQKFQFLVHPEPELSGNRFNEGKCDRAGRFWIGSMSTTDRSASGSLYRIEPNGATHKMLTGIVVPNCLVWSLDGRYLFFADSYKRLIWRYRYEAESGAIDQPEVFVDCSGSDEMPDGGAIDADGCLWNAKFGGGRVVRYTPAGEVDRVIELPATQVTSCAFAGPALDELVIVTAKKNLADDVRATQKEAGDLFIIRPGVTGVHEPTFGAGKGSGV